VGNGTGDVAYPICWTVCVSVCLSVSPVYCGKTSYWICMLLGVVGQLGPRMRQVYRGGDRPMGRGNFGCNQLGLCGLVVLK